MGRACRHEPTKTRVYDPGILGSIIGRPVKPFTGPDYDGWFVSGRFGGTCEFGNCTEVYCPVCGCNKGGWGPMSCPCDDTIGYREMRRKPHVAVKKSAAGRAKRHTNTRR